jgi:hypothetical protein
MRIEALTGSKVVVELNANDMQQLNITYDALDYADVDTRRVIWIILDHVRESTGCDIDPSGQLLIDAMPRPDGGCILFFTIKSGESALELLSCPSQRVLRKQQQLLITFEFDSIDALLDCAAAYARIDGRQCDRLFNQSELFQQGLRYRLLLSPTQQPDALRQFFCEFAQCCGESTLTAAQTREHWQPIGQQCFAHMGGGGPNPPLRRKKAALRPGNVYTNA